MNHYFGGKIVKAVPMTRQEYNDYRGWSLPADEVGEDKGFLVEYIDGGEPNHSNHQGYISWSPEAVFKNSYLDMGDVAHLQPHQQRVVAEKVELEDRLTKLNAFVQSVRFATVDSDERSRLLTQVQVMSMLLSVLEERIAAFQ